MIEYDKFRSNLEITTAIEADDTELLQLVIDNGADVNSDVGNGWTPLHLAFDYAIDGMIQNNKEQPYPEIMKTIKILLDNGASMDKIDSTGQKPLSSLNTYAGTLDGFNSLKNMFRAIIPDIDSRVTFNKNAS
ncbi:MAG: ankyrin repeat domain-containing protein [Chitinophagaceae bacterium]